MSRLCRFVLITGVLLVVAALLDGLVGFPSLPPRSVSFAQSVKELDAYDFVELTAEVAPPRPLNPFMDATLSATFETVTGDKRWRIDGFCDAEDGSLHRVRFMPSVPGDYRYSVQYLQGWSRRNATGTFHVRR